MTKRRGTRTTDPEYTGGCVVLVMTALANGLVWVWRKAKGFFR